MVVVMSQIYAYVTTYQIVHFKYVQSLSFIIYTSVSLFLKYPSKTTLSTLPSGTNTLVFSPFNIVLDFFNACITRSKYWFFLRGGWTGRPGVLRFTGSQRVGHDWATELNWMYENILICPKLFLFFIFYQLILTQILPYFNMLFIDQMSEN